MMQLPQVLRFSRFELHTAENRLLAEGRTVPLGSRALDVLKALVQRPGQLLTKNELLELAWPNTVVQENNLPAQISALRKVLGNDVITTVSGKGYRFSLPIEVVGGSSRTSVEPSIAPSHRTNLPHHLAPMVGREIDLLTLQDLVGTGSLVTVVGPGGIGKSRLVQHFLEQRIHQYPHGVCWIELASVADAAALPAAVASALGLQSGPTLTLNALAKAMAPLQMLIALDNAEHLLETVAALADTLCRLAKNISLVVTSQVPLKLKAEQVHRLGPLAVPDRALPAQEARQFAAVALFEQCANNGGRRFELNDTNATDCASLCRALDGLPLAIELAAARLPVLGLRRLMASLPERLKLLTVSADRMAPLRQQTLRATIDWSHSLLEERERRVFRRLALVAGSADLDLIHRLVGSSEDEDHDPWATVDAVQLLTERSLLTLVDQGSRPGLPPRYRMLQSTRAYAMERLCEANEIDATQRSHARAMAEFFTTAWPKRWDGSEGIKEWQHRLAPDLDNARDAMSWALSHGATDLVARIAVTLLHVLDSSQYSERLAVGESCLAVIDKGLPPDLLLQTWLALSFVWIDSHWPRSEVATQKAVELARSQHVAGHDPFWLYLALGRMAANSARANEIALAERTLREMRQLEDRSWPAQRLLTGSIAAGLVAFVSGDSSAAMARTRHGLALMRAAGEDVGNALCNLIDVEIAAGEPEAAVETGSMLMRHLRDTRDTKRQCLAALNLTAAWLALKRTSQARSLAAAGLELALEFDIVMLWCDHLAQLAALEGRFADALHLAGCSDKHYEDRGIQRLGNEATSINRACALAQAALGAAATSELREEGRYLPRQLIAEVALRAVGQRSARMTVVHQSPELFDAMHKH